ncbi:hypothetical protein EK21DRAFT_84848 [Setomelanomma holmii]|uniref:Uncharacterized protein n=1 Tax=Setomelanomma holmii TaxID=210430 RepID=A0A9P4HLM2_9PLEO|nr:hypothetical protein EK21DRAFT_84848 [Setomelanomma holmii]
MCNEAAACHGDWTSEQQQPSSKQSITLQDATLTACKADELSSLAGLLSSDMSRAASAPFSILGLASQGGVLCVPPQEIPLEAPIGRRAERRVGTRLWGTISVAKATLSAHIMPPIIPSGAHRDIAACTETKGQASRAWCYRPDLHQSLTARLRCIAQVSGEVGEPTQGQLCREPPQPTIQAEFVLPSAHLPAEHARDLSGSRQAVRDSDWLRTPARRNPLGAVSPVARLGSIWRGTLILGFPHQIVGAQGVLLQSPAALRGPSTPRMTPHASGIVT